MREIKFRAYDEESKKMYQITDINFSDYVANGVCYGDWKDFSINNLLQYTGLKDKNDVEIYEGDICSFVIFDYLDNDTAYTSSVIFKYGSFGFIIKNHQREECFYELSYILFQDDEVQVLGNIYENPELLNKI